MSDDLHALLTYGPSSVIWVDPIVAEIHAIREELASKFDFDVRRMLDDVRQREVKSGHRLIHAPPSPAKNGRVGATRGLAEQP
jgi:hypothetical protein